MQQRPGTGSPPLEKHATAAGWRGRVVPRLEQRERVRPRSGGSRKVRIGVAEVAVRDGQRGAGVEPLATVRFIAHGSDSGA